MTGGTVTDVIITILAYVAGIGVGCAIVEYKHMQEEVNKAKLKLWKAGLRDDLCTPPRRNGLD